MGRQLVVIVQEHAARDAAAGGATCQQSKKKKAKRGWGRSTLFLALRRPLRAAHYTLPLLHVYWCTYAVVACVRGVGSAPHGASITCQPRSFGSLFRASAPLARTPPRTHTHTTPFSRDMTVLHMRISTERHLGAPLRARAYLCQQPQPLGGRVCACDLVCVEAQRELPGGARGRREVEELAIHALGGPQGQRHTR